MKTMTLFAGLAALSIATSASAGSIRCGTHVIEDGGTHPPSMAEVIEKCGEPEKRRAGELIYTKKKKRLVFDTNGKLRAIHEASESPDAP